MSRDVFNRNSDTFGGAFSAEQATLTFPRITDGSADIQLGADVGLLVQRLQLSYQQQITRLYEVGQPRIYYVGGRTAGEVSIERVIGPKTITAAFYQTYGDICAADGNTVHMELTSGCDTTSMSTVSYECYFCVITTVGVGVTSADMLINESLRLMFSSLIYST